MSLFHLVSVAAFSIGSAFSTFSMMDHETGEDFVSNSASVIDSNAPADDSSSDTPIADTQDDMDAPDAADDSSLESDDDTEKTE